MHVLKIINCFDGSPCFHGVKKISAAIISMTHNESKKSSQKNVLGSCGTENPLHILLAKPQTIYLQSSKGLFLHHVRGG